ncbi:hypothetical protein EJ04DRAFT_507707 [Polyplosphaeria fusca]|uniref:SWIM-type domain-containing protein n=1 Tax=Polyplosphaeria fusca TaxID=682080 RepID=A0A9P4V8U5_9PLEO|nr:hypothetical protein EJ04DRAFT_507707 [Polyplosphaeria fusca]
MARIKKAAADNQDEETAVPATRSLRKRKAISYAEPEAADSEWLETPKKKTKTFKVQDKDASPFVKESDEQGMTDEGDSDQVHIVALKKPKPKVDPVPKAPNPKKKGRQPDTVVETDSNGVEIRKRDYLMEPSQKFLAGKIRAETQRIMFAGRERCDHDDYPAEKFQIIGSVGNTYTVTVGLVNKCSCPDYAFRRNSCKHIIYVMINVLYVRDDLQYQLAFTTDELRHIFNAAPLAPALRVKVEETSNPNRKPIEGECPICYMEFEPDAEAISYCKNSCGNNIHTDCINTWVKAKQKEHKTATCPYCRETWA